MSKQTSTISNAKAFTYIGFSEYDGKQELYDGNFDPKCEGSVERVVAYLQNLRVLADTRESQTLKWRGRNGDFYRGSFVHEIINSEIQALEDGSHFSLNV
jgi:hypothetical protein